MQVWDSLSFIYGHAHLQKHSIKNFGIILSCTCTYSAVMCMYMLISSTYFMYMYIHLTWCAWQATSKKSTGCVCLDINLLKPTRIKFAGDPSPSLSLPHGTLALQKWLDSVYRTAHHALCWLPTKLADWIGENLQDALGFPEKADQRAEPGTDWTPQELNHILQAHVVDGALSTFGCVEWESAGHHVCQILSI